MNLVEPTGERLIPPLSPEYIQQSLDIVVTYFRNKRESLMKSYGSQDGITIKPDGSLLTDRDPEVEIELKAHLKLFDPDVGFAGEETAREGSKDTYWLIDPIDSTRSFIEGRPYCTNMAALIHRGKPVSAVIFEFASEPAHMFTATEEGAFMDGQPLRVNAEQVDRTIWIDNEDKIVRNKLYDRVKSDGFTLSSLPPPNGYRLTQLAQGNLGVQVYTKANAGQYDLVPGLFIAQQSGVRVRNIESATWDISNLEIIAYTSEEDARKVESTLSS